jgi:hypothetical protein
MPIPSLDPIVVRTNSYQANTRPTPYTPNWWMTSTIAGIPESSVGWLTAQGWQITGTSTNDGVTYYTLSRQSMQNWKIMQSLLNEYVYAYNEARFFNSTRYDEIAENYNMAIVTTRGTLNEIADRSDYHVGLYLSQIDNLITEFEADTGKIKDQCDDDQDAIDAQLALYLSKLNTLDSEYTTHQTTTRGLLTDLGTAETARINDRFDALLAKTKQSLVNRGLYSSTLYSNYATQIETQRSRELTDLNDRLNREKLQNEHSLWQELVQIREQVLSGRLRYNDAVQRRTGFLVDTKHRLVMALMQARFEKANARLGIRDREEKLMAYQLDTRNNLSVALFGFKERREDTYPDQNAITKLVAGLGDSGGGWVTP